VPHPSPSPDAPGTYGPFRLQLRIGTPPDYEEQWLPGGGLPGSMVSEVQVGIAAALDAQPAAAEVTVTTTNPATGGSSAVTSTVQVGSDQAFRGTPDMAWPPPAEGPDVQLWTAQVWCYAENPPSATPLDFAVVAREWASRVATLVTESGAECTLQVVGVWTSSGDTWWPLDAGYPDNGHTVVVA
jgi:hypothetical protein